MLFILVLSPIGSLCSVTEPMQIDGLSHTPVASLCFVSKAVGTEKFFCILLSFSYTKPSLWQVDCSACYIFHDGSLHGLLFRAEDEDFSKMSADLNELHCIMPEKIGIFIYLNVIRQKGHLSNDVDVLFQCLITCCVLSTAYSFIHLFTFHGSLQWI
jgi:hypothetical protein